MNSCKYVENYLYPFFDDFLTHTSPNVVGGGLRRQKLRPSVGDNPFLGPQDCEVELLIPLNNTPADLLKRYILIQMNIIPCMPKLNDCSRIISQFAMSVADLRSRTVRFSGLELEMYSVWQCCLLCGD